FGLPGDSSEQRLDREWDSPDVTTDVQVKARQSGHELGHGAEGLRARSTNEEDRGRREGEHRSAARIRLDSALRTIEVEGGDGDGAQGQDWRQVVPSVRKEAQDRLLAGDIEGPAIAHDEPIEVGEQRHVRAIDLCRPEQGMRARYRRVRLEHHE